MSRIARAIDLFLEVEVVLEGLPFGDFQVYSAPLRVTVTTINIRGELENTGRDSLEAVPAFAIGLNSDAATARGILESTNDDSLPRRSF